MKLFVFYIGGDAPGSNIELHDLRMVVASTLEDCIPVLKREWWGIPETLHLDCWGELKHADGYDIVLKPEPPTAAEKLWFINLGGYQPGEFTELHKNLFIAATTEVKARAKALKHILDWRGHHKDTQFEVEKIINLNDAAQTQGLHIHLIASDNAKPFKFDYGYKPIGKPGYVLKAAVADVTIRQFTPDKWSAFKGMRLKALKSDAGVFSAKYEEAVEKPDSHWQGILNDPHTAIFGIYDAGEIIGITAIGTHSDPEQKIATLWASWLKPEYRSRGISKQMYDARLDWARRHPTIERVIAGHRASNIASANAIKKHGFSYRDTEQKTWPDGQIEDAYNYELIIKQNEPT